MRSPRALAWPLLVWMTMTCLMNVEHDDGPRVHSRFDLCLPQIVPFFLYPCCSIFCMQGEDSFCFAVSSHGAIVGIVHKGIEKARTLGVHEQFFLCVGLLSVGVGHTGFRLLLCSHFCDQPVPSLRKKRAWRGKVFLCLRVAVHMTLPRSAVCVCVRLRVVGVWHCRTMVRRSCPGARSVSTLWVPAD
eukprot:RCo052586